jgi:hypothetical protein
MYYIGLDVHKRTISYCVKDAAGCVIAAAKRKNDRIDASKIADCLRCDFLPECHMAAENTAHLEEVRTSIVNLDTRTKRQEEADALANRANWVSITVHGEADAGQPLSIYLTGTEPNIHFTRVEFRSEAGNVFGTSPGDCPTE